LRNDRTPNRRRTLGGPAPDAYYLPSAASTPEEIVIVAALKRCGGDGVPSKSLQREAGIRDKDAFYQALHSLEDKGEVTVNGEKLELTKNEFKILQLLFENAGQTVSREAIMKRLWDNDCFVDDNTLTVNMTRLRGKLAELGLPDYIKTRRGMGYQAAPVLPV